MNNQKAVRSIRIFTIAAVFMLGIESGGFQLMLVEIASEYGLSATAMGTLVTVQYAAMLAIPLLFGRLADRVGKKRILQVFLPMLILGCALILVSPLLAAFYLGIFLIGAGYSMLESMSSAALSDAAPAKAEQNITLTQAFYSVGAMAGPAAVQMLLSRGIGWRAAFGGMMVGFILLLFLLAPVRFVNAQPAEVSGTRSAAGAGSLRCPAFTALVISICLYGLLETGFSFFLDYFFRGALSAGHLSALALAVFWLAQAGSRLLFGLSGRKPGRTVVALYLASGVSVLLAALCRSTGPAVVLCAVAGVSFGPIWPILIGSGTRNFPECSGTASGILMSFSGFGGAVAPTLLGWVADRMQARASMFLLGALGLIGAAACILSMHFLERRENR